MHNLHSHSIRRGILAASILGFTALASHAAVVSWGAAQGIAGDSDVSTAGTLVGAFNLGGTGVSSPAVNGVTFTGFAVPSGSTNVTSGNFNLTSPGISFAGNSLTTGSAPFSTLSAPYQALLSSATGGSGSGPITLNISGLAIGQNYQFQWWTNDSVGLVGTQTATAGNAVTLASNTGGFGGLGQFAVGTFTADATSQSIVFTSSNVPLLDAFQLRNLSASAVPEPGSALAGMLALGVCLSGLGARQRRVAT